MLRGIKIFFTELTILSTLTGVNLLKCVSMNNQKCKVRPQNVNVDSDEPVFFPFGIKAGKCSGSYKNINDPYAKLCVADAVKNLNAISLSCHEQVCLIGYLLRDASLIIWPDDWRSISRNVP